MFLKISMLLLMTAVALGCDTPGKASDGRMDSGPDHDVTRPDSIQDTGSVRSIIGWRISRSDRSEIVFDTGDTLRTRATDLHLLNKMVSPLGKSWFIFSGMDNDDPDRLYVLYVVSPGDSLSRGLQHSWHMPGRLMDHTDAGVYYEASVFAGEVLRDTVGVIWYDRSLMPDGQWRSNTTLLQLDRPEPDTLVLFGQGRKSSTIDLAMKGKCQMLAPVDQKTAPH
jgi:hypothetical protein